MAHRFFTRKFTIALSLIIALAAIFQKQVKAIDYTITINSDIDTGAIKYGGIGWLYGLGELDLIFIIRL